MASYQQGVPIKINDTFRVAGVETDPTTIVWTILKPDGDTETYTWPGDLEVTHVGVGQFSLALSPPALPGLYQYDVDATGAVVASRAGAFTVLANAATDANITWAVQGPCTPWTSSQAAWNCCGQPTEIVDGDECAVDFSEEVMIASELLFELSGRLFSGFCEKTVRPCRTGCGCTFGQVLSRGHIVPSPWSWGGNSWWCDGNPCGCRPLSKVLLSGYPVREILEVKIDGDVVDPDTYELRNYRWLVRTRDPADPDTALSWPSCQDDDLPDTEDGTFSVTYTYGQDPPLAGQRAAAALACEISKTCSASGDGDCTIPTNAVRVTRQGVTIDKNATLAWFFEKDGDKGWQTGIPMVDSFLNSFNRSGMIARPLTWSPDGARFAVKQGV